MNKKGALTLFLLSSAVIAIAAIMLIFSYKEETVFHSKSDDLNSLVHEIKFYTESCLTNLISEEIINLGAYDDLLVKEAVENNLGKCFDYKGIHNSEAIKSVIYRSLEIKEHNSKVYATLSAEITVLMDGKKVKINTFNCELKI